MTNSTTVKFTLEQLCDATELPLDTVIEIVEQGIIEPVGDNPRNWVFNAQMITVTKKALRLHRDLDIDWAGIALAIDLIEQLESVRAENQRLRSQLNRFIS